MSAENFPAAKEDDPEDVAWALSTAEALFRRGEFQDAIAWVRRAANSAAESDLDDRVLELAKAVAELSTRHAQTNPSLRAVVPPTAESTLETGSIRIDIELDSVEPALALSVETPKHSVLRTVPMGSLASDRILLQGMPREPERSATPSLPTPRAFPSPFAPVAIESLGALLRTEVSLPPGEQSSASPPPSEGAPPSDEPRIVEGPPPDFAPTPGPMLAVARVSPHRETQDFALDPAPRDFALAPKLRDFALDPKPRDSALDPKPRDFALDPKPRDFALDPKARDFALDPKARDFALDPKARDFALDPTALAQETEELSSADMEEDSTAGPPAPSHAAVAPRPGPPPRSSISRSTPPPRPTAKSPSRPAHPLDAPTAPGTAGVGPDTAATPSSEQNPVGAGRGIPDGDRIMVGLASSQDQGRSSDRARSRESADRGRSPEPADRGRSRESADRGRSPESADRGRSPESADSGPSIEQVSKTPNSQTPLPRVPARPKTPPPRRPPTEPLALDDDELELAPPSILPQRLLSRPPSQHAALVGSSPSLPTIPRAARAPELASLIAPETHEPARSAVSPVVPSWGADATPEPPAVAPRPASVLPAPSTPKGPGVSPALSGSWLPPAARASDPSVSITKTRSVIPASRPLVSEMEKRPSNFPRPSDLAPPPPEDPLSVLPDAVRELFEAEAERLVLLPEEEIEAPGLVLITQGSLEIMSAAHPTPLEVASHGLRRLLPESPAETRLGVRGGPRGARFHSFTFAQAGRLLKLLPEMLAEELEAGADDMHAVAGLLEGPLGEHVEGKLLQLLLLKCETIRLEPQAKVVRQGELVQSLVLLGAGSLSLRATEAPDALEIGTVERGFALYGRELLDKANAPATVRAGRTGALVLVANRKSTDQLIALIPQLVDLLSTD